MKYYIRYTSERTYWGRFGKTTFVDRIEYFKTSNSDVLAQANKSKQYKFREIDINNPTEYKIRVWLRKFALEDSLYYNLESERLNRYDCENFGGHIL